MTILVTGSAGFIGFHVSRTLLKKKQKVIGVDNINNYTIQKLRKIVLKIFILREKKILIFLKLIFLILKI